MRIIDWSSDVCSSDLASAHWRGNICCPTRIRRSGKSDRTNAVQAARKIPPHALPDRAGGYPERRDRTQNVVPVPRDGGYRDQARYRWAHNVAYQARDKPTPPADRRHRSAPGQGQAMTAAVAGRRSEERRDGKEGGGTGSSRGS